MQKQIKQRTGITQKVRDAAKEMTDKGSHFSVRDLVWHMDTSSAREDRSVRRAFVDLRKRGEIKRIGYAKYRFVKDLTPKANVRQRIYRAMHVKGAFCARDIKILTDADKSYIMAIIRKLKNAGHLEYTGRSKAGNHYRVRQADEFYLNFVKNESNATD